MFPLTEKGREESPESVTAGAAIPPIDFPDVEEEEPEPLVVVVVVEPVEVEAWEPVLLLCPAAVAP